MMTNRVGLSVQSKLTILYILARRPGGQATFDELEREMKGLGERAEQTDNWSEFVELADIDVFRSGLVSCDDQGSFRITEAGRSLLRAIEDLAESSQSSEEYRAQSLKLIDDLIGAERRSAIVNLEPRSHGEKLDLGAPHGEPGLVRGIGGQVNADTEPAKLKGAGAKSLVTMQSVQNVNCADRIDNTFAIQSSAPSFLKRHFGSKVRTSFKLSRAFKPSNSAALSVKRFTRILRGHLESDVPNFKTPRERGGAGVAGAVLVVLSLLVIVIGAGAVIAVNHIKSLKAEIATLQRELVVIKNQTARLEAAESKREADQNDNRGRPDTEKTDGSGQSRQEASVLGLSPDEIRAIREYIKPAPIAGPAISPSINVGDHITEATIPVPSPLTDKVPKLLGARFTIRNGAIVLIKRDSHQADAVLPPY
jgi:hypothetical protein